jgi:FkbM family methyltransferase
MLEVGAGHGRWLVRAAAAVKRYNPVPMLLVGIEAEPTHVEWMDLNFQNNGLDPTEHRIVHAAVAGSRGSAYFPVGDPNRWGQFIVESSKTGPQDSRHLQMIFEDTFLSKVTSVPQMTLADAAPEDDFIDFIDMDVQGAEAEIMEQAIAFCSERVRLIHIGTHSHPIEDRRQIFCKAGWHSRFDFPQDSTTPTSFGTLRFEDGVQSWANPRFIDRLIDAGLIGMKSD